MILKRIFVICVAIISCTQLYLVLLGQTAHITKDTTITDWLSVIAYFFTLFAAVSAAVFAWNANQINKQLFEKQNQPTVEFSLFFLPNFFGMVTLELKNSSQNIARNLNFRFEIIREDQCKNAHTMIEQLQYTQFTVVGLNSLSSLETRYLGYINTHDLSFDKGNAEIKVVVNYIDINGGKYSNFYVLNLDELKGITKIGKSFDEQRIEQLKNINKNIRELKVEHERFKNEYEKTHRDWTEAELRRKIGEIDSKRSLYKHLGKEYLEEVATPKKKLSIHQFRRENK